MPRLSPRHVTETLLVEQYGLPGGSQWAGAWSSAVTLAAQVEHRRELAVTGEGVTAHTVLVARIPVEPPLDDGVPTDHFLTLAQLRERLAQITLNSRVTTPAGHASYVLAVREVLSRGRLQFVEVTTGDVPPRWGGWLVTDAVLVRTAGRDRRGDPIEGESVPIPEAVVRQVASAERVDEYQDAETTAELILPATSTLEISTTDHVLLASSPMAGLYQVAGRPDPRTDRTLVPLRRM